MASWFEQSEGDFRGLEVRRDLPPDEPGLVAEPELCSTCRVELDDDGFCNVCGRLAETTVKEAGGA